jgi:hypothetical protein
MCVLLTVRGGGIQGPFQIDACAVETGNCSAQRTTYLKVHDALDRQNRWASNALTPVLIHFVAPHGKLLQCLLALE